jgi:hypothetical protein
MHPIIIIIAGGVFFLIASYKNWNWFFKIANPFGIPILKRKGLRIYFTIVGLALIGYGIYVLFDYY